MAYQAGVFPASPPPAIPSFTLRYADRAGESISPALAEDGKGEREGLGLVGVAARLDQNESYVSAAGA